MRGVVSKFIGFFLVNAEVHRVWKGGDGREITRRQGTCFRVFPDGNQIVMEWLADGSIETEHVPLGDLTREGTLFVFYREGFSPRAKLTDAEMEYRKNFYSATGKTPEEEARAGTQVLRLMAVLLMLGFLALGFFVTR